MLGAKVVVETDEGWNIGLELAKVNEASELTNLDGSVDLSACP